MELEDSNKKSKEVEYEKDQIDNFLLGTESTFKTRNQELNQAKYITQEMKKTMVRALEMKKEAGLDFEAQIQQVRGAFKKCKNELSCESHRKEES